MFSLSNLSYRIYPFILTASPTSIFPKPLSLASKNCFAAKVFLWSVKCIISRFFPLFSIFLSLKMTIPSTRTELSSLRRASLIEMTFPFELPSDEKLLIASFISISFSVSV